MSPFLEQSNETMSVMWELLAAKLHEHSYEVSYVMSLAICWLNMQTCLPLVSISFVFQFVFEDFMLFIHCALI